MFQADNTVFTNCDVFDASGDKLGTISDVVSDAETLEPRWLVVDVGLMKSSHYLPVAVVERNADGQFVVAFDKETIKSATKPNHGHVLSVDEERELMEHYGMAS